MKLVFLSLRLASKLVKTPNTASANSGQGNTTSQPVEKDQYFYHGDHLGSSNMITDTYGEVYQHLEYFPYGETWIDEGKTPVNIPGYQFTGKELNPETGLYYFGARYYEPKISRWISADPILGKYLPTGDKERDRSLPGGGGAYNPINFSAYSYAGLNPLNLIDPDGNFFIAMEFYRKTSDGKPDWQRIRRYQFYEGAVATTAGAMEALPFVAFGVGAAPEVALQVAVRFPKTTAFTTSLVAGLAGVPTPTQGVIVKPGKWDYFFGRVFLNPHNQARSLQNLKDLNTLGFNEAAGGREALMKLFEQGKSLPEVARHVTRYGITVTKSIPIGNIGAIDVKYFYTGGNMNAIPEISTIITKIYQ